MHRICSRSPCMQHSRRASRQGVSAAGTGAYHGPSQAATHMPFALGSRTHGRCATAFFLSVTVESILGPETSVHSLDETTAREQW